MDFIRAYLQNARRRLAHERPERCPHRQTRRLRDGGVKRARHIKRKQDDFRIELVSERHVVAEIRLVETLISGARPLAVSAMRRDVRRVPVFRLVVFVEKASAVGAYQKAFAFLPHVSREQVARASMRVEARGERRAPPAADGVLADQQLGGWSVTGAPASAAAVFFLAAVRNRGVNAESARAQVGDGPHFVPALRAIRFGRAQRRQRHGAASSALVQALVRGIIRVLGERVIDGGDRIDVGCPGASMQLLRAGRVLRERDSQVAGYLGVEILGFVAVFIIVVGRDEQTDHVDGEGVFRQQTSLDERIEKPLAIVNGARGFIYFVRKLRQPFAKFWLERVIHHAGGAGQKRVSVSPDVVL